MIDFSTLQGLSIPEGVVTQIADASGRVLWAVQSGGKVILEVEKITSDTYVGETTYTAEEFIRMAVTVKDGGTVTVTYGGITRTLVAEEVTTYGTTWFHPTFGIFNGVDYNSEVPSSGELTIEGDYEGIGISDFSSANKKTSYCNCVKNIVSLGNIKSVLANGFQDCVNITNVPLPDTIKSLGSSAFKNCTGLRNIVFPQGLENIIANAFNGCTNLNNIIFKNTIGWYFTTDIVTDEETIWEAVDVTDPENNVTLLTETALGQYTRKTS